MPPLTRNDQLAILIEKIRQLTCRIQEAEQDERTGDKETEKQVLLRQLRQDRRDLRKEFTDIILVKSEIDHATETETKRRDDQFTTNYLTKIPNRLSVNSDTQITL